MTIISTDDVLSGAPRIDGMRVSVVDVRAAINYGMTDEEIVSDWDITVGEVEEALAFADENPDELES